MAAAVVARDLAGKEEATAAAAREAALAVTEGLRFETRSVRRACAACGCHALVCGDCALLEACCDCCCCSAATVTFQCRPFGRNCRLFAYWRAEAHRRTITLARALTVSTWRAAAYHLEDETAALEIYERRTMHRATIEATQALRARYVVVVGKRCRVADFWRCATPSGEQVSPSGPRVLHSAH